MMEIYRSKVSGFDPSGFLRSLGVLSFVILAVVCGGPGCGRKPIEMSDDGALEKPPVAAQSAQQADAAVVERDVAVATVGTVDAARSLPSDPSRDVARARAARAPAVAKLVDGPPPELRPGEKVVEMRMTRSTNNWYNMDWRKRSSITVKGLRGLAVSNYPALVMVAFQESMQTNFADLRFTAGDRVTELAYSLEDIKPGDQAAARVSLSITTNSIRERIYMYFGNPAAQSTARPALTASFSPADREPIALVMAACDRDIVSVVIPPEKNGTTEQE